MKRTKGAGRKERMPRQKGSSDEPTARGRRDARGRNEHRDFAVSPFFAGLRCAVPVLLCILFLAGCLPGAKPPYTVQNYFLEYSAPTPNLPQLSGTVKIGRFSAVRSYDTSAMLYSSEPYKIGSYNYSRWSAYPSELVADSLLRDFRNSNLFPAVFSYRDQADARFTVAGSVEEFLQARTAEGWQVTLSVRIALLDAERPGPVVFQRRYRETIAIRSGSPDAFASGMSKAMSEVSSNILRDVYESVRSVVGGP